MKIKKTIYKISFALYAIIFIAISQYAYTQPLNEIALQKLGSPTTVPYPFSFVVIGDTRPTHDDNENGILINSSFVGMLGQIVSLNQTQPISFVINTGDVVHNAWGGDETTQPCYQAYYDFMSQWMNNNNIPYFTLPGNHEFWCGSNELCFFYYNKFVGEYLDYFFDYGNSRFILANNVQHYPGEDDGDYYFEEPQLTEIENWLSYPSAPVNKFGFVHVPLLRVEPSNLSLPGYMDYRDLLVEYEARANFHGDQHDYYRTYDCLGLYDITTGGGGAELIPGGPPTNPPIVYRGCHWLLVTVTEDSDVSVEMYFMDEGHSPAAQEFDFYMPIPKLDLQNITINIGEEKTYEALTSITAAGNDLQGNNTNFIVEGDNINGGDVTFISRKEITLKPGFHAKAGCNFHAFIEPVDCFNDNSKKMAIYYNDESEDKIIKDKAESEKNNSINIYPNPNNGNFVISLLDDADDVTSIEVTDIMGNVIYNKYWVKEQTLPTYIAIDISNRPKGIYLIRLSYNDKTISKKIIYQ